MTKEWLDNPYRTITEFVELKVNTEGKTVVEAIKELNNMMSNTDNDVAKERIKHVGSIIDDIRGNGLLDNNHAFTQAIIISKLKFKLEHEKGESV